MKDNVDTHLNNLSKECKLGIKVLSKASSHSH